MKLSIVLPVYNEVSSVRKLLESVWAQQVPHCEKEMIIVESNSTDGTREVVQHFVSEKTIGNNSGSFSGDPVGLKLILQDKPRGKGNAVREGFAAVTGDIILIQDGDLEYDVSDYPSLVQPILSGQTDFVLGSRHLAAGTWKIRKFDQNPLHSLLLNLGGILFHGFFNLLYGQHLTDPTTMYKVFRTSCIKHLHFHSNRFDFDFELVAKLIRSGFVPLEVPISYVSRGFEEGKKVNVLRDPFTWAWAILKFRFVSL